MSFLVHYLETFHLLALTPEEPLVVWYYAIGIEELIAQVKSIRSRKRDRVEILSFVVAAELILNSVIVFVRETEDQPAIDLLTSLAYAIVLYLLQDWGTR